MSARLACWLAMPDMGLQTAAVLAGPGWLLAIPDAIEQLFGVSKVRGAALITAFGAGRTGYLLTLPRAEFLRQLRRRRRRAAFRGEEARRERVVTEIRKARLTGIRVAVPVEALEARLSGLPEGVSVESPGGSRCASAGRRMNRTGFLGDLIAWEDGVY